MIAESGTDVSDYRLKIPAGILDQQIIFLKSLENSNG